MGAMGKSAQFLLHTWLPDAMEGPTPVSALIHAATMVTAGVFMVARLSPLFELCADGADRRDLRRRDHGVLRRDRRPRPERHQAGRSPIRPARSSATCSSRWASAPTRPAMFHLFTHAFFKALLFLGSGSVITRCTTSRTCATWAACASKIPITYWMMLIGTLALDRHSRFTAGFFSKDAIIEAAFAGAQPGRGLRLLCMTVIAALHHRVLFLAADLHDLPRRRRDDQHARRHASTRTRARTVDADPARASLAVGVARRRLSPFKRVLRRPRAVEALLPRGVARSAPEQRTSCDDMHHVPLLGRAGRRP